MSRISALRAVPAREEAEEFARLWDSYAQLIYVYCFRRTADAAVAEDLTSIVFLEAWRRRADVTITPDKVLPWLYGVATNVLRNRHRSQRRYEAALRRLRRPEAEPDFADSVAERLDREAQMRQILDHVQELSQLEQEVLALCVWQGLTHGDAARALDVPETTIRTRLHRARGHLRERALHAATAASAAAAPPSHQGVNLG